jgi:Phosphoinositide phospholipase C, Ca2+-dependent
MIAAMRIALFVSVLVAAGLWGAQSPGNPASSVLVTADCSTIAATNIDDCVRLNEIQLLGTHNSYHIAPEPAVLKHLGERARNIEYTHRPLAEQLSKLGIRQFELDVFADPDGGRYAKPAALQLLSGLRPPPAGLNAAGLKVLHGQDLDYRTTCPTLKACLREIRDWSKEHPWHVPIQIQIEAKDAVPDDTDGVRFVKPLAFDVQQLRAIDAEIRDVFDASHVITPDRVRGSRPTLAAAIASDGWPRLREARGKVLFALDNTEGHRIEYLRGNPSLEGRMLFVSSPPGDPSAAFLKMNEAIGKEEARIGEHVKKGFLIRTRADIPTDEARSGSTDRRDSAFRSGAHYVSTDYPEPSPFGSGYIARLPGAERLAARCNPINAPRGCRNEWLEPNSSSR